MVQVFSCPAQTKLSVSSASNEETLEMAKKTIKPPAIKRQKINNNAWMTDFHGYRHEGDVHTGKSGVSAWPFCRLCCARVETGVVNRNVIWKRGRRVTSITGGGHPGTLLGLGNFDHTGKLKVGTRYFFYHWYRVPIVSTVYWRLWNWCWKTWTDHDSGQDTVPFRGNPDYLVPQHIWIKNI